MDYNKKYIKYKTKYINLKRQIMDEQKRHLSIMKQCYEKIDKIKDYKKLMKSIYPFQDNDYFLLQFPNWYTQYIDKEDIKEHIEMGFSGKIKYVPCDAQLKNLIEYMWKHKIITEGWDYEPSEGFISMRFNTYNNKSTMELLNKLLGDIKVYKAPKIYGEKYNKWLDNIRSKNKSKIYIIKHNTFLSLNFDETSLKKIHKLLKIKKPNIKNALPGYMKCVDILGLYTKL